MRGLLSGLLSKILFLGSFSRRSRRRPGALFIYWDGSRHRKIDPVKAWQPLFSSDLDVASEIEFIQQEIDDPMIVHDQIESTNAIVSLIQEVFDFSDYDEATGEGLTINETLDVLASFFGHVSLLKKSTSPSPSVSRPTELEQFAVGSTEKSSKQSFSFGNPSSESEPTSSSSNSPMPSAETSEQESETPSSANSAN